MRSIDAKSLDELELALSLTEHIKMKQSKSVKNTLIFPEFIWAVRDFHLELEDEDGNDITPKKYLEDALGILH